MVISFQSQREKKEIETEAGIMKKKLYMAILAAGLVLSACGSTAGSQDTKTAESSVSAAETEETSKEDDAEDGTGKSKGASKDADGESGDGTEDTAGETEMFTERDLNQSPDLSEAETISLTEGEDVSITREGVYVLSGTAKDVTVTVDAGDEDKVQLVLDGVDITNEGEAFIYVKNADKVFVTTTDGENSLTVTGTFSEDYDAVIDGKDDLVINGTGTLHIASTGDGISTNDTLKVTGGTLDIECEGSALSAHDAINISDGTLNFTAYDGIHAEDNDDTTIGSVYIGGGTINITASDDAIHGTTTVQIDGGTINLTGGEGIEGTEVLVNGGTITINATDDGINAGAKADGMSPKFEMNDGTLTITMGQGDTDGIDSNGDIYVNGGTIDITGQSTFDYDGTAEYNGGTIIENGEETNTISNQMMGGGGRGGAFQGGMKGEAPEGGFQGGMNGEAPEGGFQGKRPEGAPAFGGKMGNKKQ